LRLVEWNRWPLRFSRNRSDYLFCGSGLVVVLLVMLPYVLGTSAFGPLISAAEARALPEFQPGGRSSFFTDNLWKFWLTGPRSGLLPVHIPLLTWAVLLVPILLRDSRRFPLAKHMSGHLRFLLPTLVASIALFFTAHVWLFTLHLPSRYTEHSIPIVMALASGAVLVAVLDAALRLAWQPIHARSGAQQLLACGSIALMGALLIVFPVLSRIHAFSLSGSTYKVGRAPELYEFFSRQPNEILIASLSPEANNLPTFSQRSVLVNRECAIPYHVGYYRHIRERAGDLVRAQYSQTLTEARRLIEKYGVDFFVVDRMAFTPEYLSRSWFKQFQPEATQAMASVQHGALPALSRVMERCRVFETKDAVVLEAACVASAAQEFVLATIAPADQELVSRP
jgi:hypothetical protein